MRSSGRNRKYTCRVSPLNRLLRGLTLTVELQGHAIKNKDLLAASGAITLRGTDSYDALAEDEEDVSIQRNVANAKSRSQLQSTSQYDMSADIEQRATEITQIATSISELADLFRDLGSLVVAQGTVLDSVEYNVQQTAKQMEDAVEELTVARKYQSNTGRRRCILLLILIIVGLILVLIYKPRRHGSAPDPTPTDATPPMDTATAAAVVETPTPTAEESLPPTGTPGADAIDWWR